MPCRSNIQKPMRFVMMMIITIFWPHLIQADPYLGCYTDSTTVRDLNGVTYADATAMTVESCISFCVSYKYTYAGVQFAYIYFFFTFLSKTISA